MKRGRAVRNPYKEGRERQSVRRPRDGCDMFGSDRYSPVLWNKLSAPVLQTRDYRSLAESVNRKRRPDGDFYSFINKRNVQGRTEDDADGADGRAAGL